MVHERQQCGDGESGGMPCVGVCLSVSAWRRGLNGISEQEYAAANQSNVAGRGRLGRLGVLRQCDASTIVNEANGLSRGTLSTPSSRRLNVSA